MVDQALPTQRFELRRESGKTYQLLSVSGNVEVKMAIKSGGWIEVNRARYTITRESGWGDYVLLLEGLERARATKNGIFSWRFDVRSEDLQSRLQTTSSFSSNFVSQPLATPTDVSESGLETTPTFEMQKRGFWSTRGEIVVHRHLPIDLLAFQAWLAMLMWIQADDAPGPPIV